MAAPIPDLAALNLDPNQTTGVNRILQDARLAAREEAKLEFRSGVAGSRRPDIFDPTTMSITTYFDNFEPFKLLMNLTGDNAINTFLTYMDQKSRNTLASQDVTNLGDWDLFKQRVRELLSSPREAVQSRFELKKASQRPDETVAQFGDRLIGLGRLGYKANEDVARESALKDALSGGVTRDEISVYLISNLNKTFLECLEEANKLDSAYRARLTLKEGDGISVSVMKTEQRRDYTPTSANSPSSVNQTERRPPTIPELNQGYNSQSNLREHDRSSPRMSNRMSDYPRNEVICYCCNETGHYAPECPLNQNTRFRLQPRGREPLICYYCGKQGHTARACRKKMYDDRTRERMDNDRRNNWGPRDQRRGYNPSLSAYPFRPATTEQQAPFEPRNQSDPRRNPLPEYAQQAYNSAVEHHSSRNTLSTNYPEQTPLDDHRGVRFSEMNMPTASNPAYPQTQASQMSQSSPRTHSTVPLPKN